MVEREDLPERIFAAGEEPSGERVTAYHKSGQIKTILDTLEKDEVEILQKSPWAKFIATADKPRFSGRFARYALTRQLKVNKKNEIWVLFAGRPIRFSLREFAAVTGLPCGEIPQNKKKRKLRLKEEPYWGKLFGTIRSISVSEVIALLQRKTVGDKDMRIKYACLALLGSVLCPTSSLKIVPWHAEIISDLEEFFAYPWGRVSFEMTIKSIRERDAVGLSQQTIAVKGFVHAFQLVMVEAVPSLLEVPQAAYYCYSESEDEEDTVSKKKHVAKKVRRTDNDKSGGSAAMCIIPGHARNIDEACEVVVDSIIPDPVDVEIDETKLVWSDEIEDPKVDKLLELVHIDYEFNKHMFVGGYTKEEVARLEKEKKEQQEREKELKAKKGKQKDVLHSEGESSGMSENHLDQLAGMVFDKVKVCFASMDEKVDSLLDKINDLRHSVDEVEAKVSKIPSLESLISEIVKVVSQNGPEHREDRNGGQFGSPRTAGRAQDGGIQNEDLFEDGVTRGNVVEDILQRTGQDSEEESEESEEKSEESQEDGGGGESDGTLAKNTSDGESPEEVSCGAAGDRVLAGAQTKQRSTRRKRITPARLKDDYDREKRIKKRDAEILGTVLGDRVGRGSAHKWELLIKSLKTMTSIELDDGIVLSNKELRDIGERTKVLSAKMLDVLVSHSRLAFTNIDHSKSGDRVVLFDTKLVANLLRCNQKFLKSRNTADFKVPEAVKAYFTDEDGRTFDATRIYFPLSFDRQHWVGICVDLKAKQILILDCNWSMRSDKSVNHSLNPLASMFPHLMQAVLGNESSTFLEPFSLLRVKGIPQNPIHSDSGVTALLLMRAHAFGGIIGCGVVKPEVVAQEAVNLAVSIYEQHVGVLVD